MFSLVQFNPSTKCLLLAVASNRDQDGGYNKLGYIQVKFEPSCNGYQLASLSVTNYHSNYS